MAESNLDKTYKEMSNAEKTALLFIALGQKWATEMMRSLRTQEVKRISYWISRMNHVPQELTERIIKDFYERLVRKSSIASSGGREYLMDVLSNMMGETRAREVVDDLSVQEEHEVFRILKKVEPRQLASYLKQEQPQTVALLLSYLEPSRAGPIISEMPQEKQVDVITRLAKLEKTDPEVIAVMEKTLTDNLGSMASSDKMKKVGGPKTVAEILNNVSKTTQEFIMARLSEQEFDLASKIKDLMFVFADIMLVDDKSIQAVLKEVEQADLVMSLKGSTEAIQNKIFKNISKHQADTIKDEISFLGPVKSSTVIASQQKIVNVIRKLDSEGKILIQGKGGGDDIIA